jgi:nitroreductase
VFKPTNELIGKMIGSAALGIVVCGDLEAAHDKQLGYLLQDCSAAIENLLLCAHIPGLGACLAGGPSQGTACEEPDMQEILGLQEKVIPVACIAIGYPAETKEPRTRFNPNYVRFEA